MADFKHGRVVGKHDTMKNTQAKQNKRGELARISYKRAKGVDRAADKLSRPVQEEIEQVDELSKPLLKRFSIAATKKADRLEAEGDYHSRHLQKLWAAEKAGKPTVGKPSRISQLRKAAYKKSDRLRAASDRAQKRAE
jgi:hypothetical protein